MTRSNKRATLPAGWKWLSTPNSIPSAADATAKPSIDQPCRGAGLDLLGLIDSLTLNPGPGEFLALPRCSKGIIGSNRPEIVTDKHTLQPAGGEQAANLLQPTGSSRQATTLDAKVRDTRSQHRLWSSDRPACVHTPEITNHHPCRSLWPQEASRRLPPPSSRRRSHDPPKRGARPQSLRRLRQR
jgi:hypothetical protein